MGDFDRGARPQAVDTARRVIVSIDHGHAVVEVSGDAIEPLRWCPGGLQWHPFDGGSTWPEQYDDAKEQARYRQVEV